MLGEDLDPLLTVDADLDAMSPEALRAEVKKLRAAIRAHRDSSGHNLCWFVPELWGTLPEAVTPRPEAPPSAEFAVKCREYRASLERTVPLQANRACPYCRGEGSSRTDGVCPRCRPYCDRCDARWNRSDSVDCPNCCPVFPPVEKRLNRPVTQDEATFLNILRFVTRRTVGHSRLLQFVVWDWMAHTPRTALIPSHFEPASTLHP